jgi:hypothetical protein
MKLKEPGNSRMKLGALMNYLIDQKGHNPALRRQVKTYLQNHRKHMASMLLGVSSYGGVVTKIENMLSIDRMLASPDATLDTSGVIGYRIDVGNGRFTALVSSIKMAMFGAEQQVAGYSDGCLLKDDTFKTSKELLVMQVSALNIPHTWLTGPLILTLA